MVWGVCRRVLRDYHDAEDPFRATFLVLARRAALIMPREKVGNWLCDVADQTAVTRQYHPEYAAGTKQQPGQF
jgi:RNA polymerase sigma-70 factor (ECF subfamily)